METEKAGEEKSLVTAVGMARFVLEEGRDRDGR